MRNIDRLLHKAIIAGKEEQARHLVGEGALPLARNSFGFTASEMAHFMGVALEPTEPLQIKFQGRDEPSVRILSCEEFRNVTGVTYLSHLQFENYKVFKRVLRQCPWLLKYTSLGRQHKWFGALYGKEVYEGKVADASIRWIDEEIGYGLFAEKELPPQSFVGAYTGILRQWHRFSPNHNEYCFHYPTGFWRMRIFMIDAEETGNITRFVNHSADGNLEPVALLDRGLLHVFFKTARTIEVGEQMTVNYGPDYWRRRQNLKPLITK